MSTKIYDGFVFKSQDFNEVYKTVDDFRRKLQPLIRKRVREHMAFFATDFILDYILGEKKAKDTLPIIYAHSTFIKEWKLNKESGFDVDPFCDFDCNIVVFPYKNKFYGVIYTVQEEFKKMFLKNKNIEEFGYWDNTDPLEKVPHKEWRNRGKIWSDILHNFDDSPNICGVTFECNTAIYKYTTFNAADLMPYIPKLSKIIEGQAREELLRDFAKKIKEDCNISKNIPLSVYDNFNKWLKTEEGQKALEEKRAIMTEKLRKIEHISKEDLSTSVTENKKFN